MTRYERLLQEYEQVKSLEFVPALHERIVLAYEEEIKRCDKAIADAKHLLKYMLEEDYTERKGTE